AVHSAQEESALAAWTGKGEIAFVSGEALALVAKEGKGSYILDSGCTWHMSPELEAFEGLRDIAPIMIWFRGQDMETVVIQAGDLVGIGENGCQIHFRNAIYAPNLVLMLLLVRQLADSGANITFKRNSALIWSNISVIMANCKGQALWIIKV